MKGVKHLTEGRIQRQLFQLALPIMATSFIQMAYSLTDMAWVGRLGSEAVAAIGAVGLLMWLSSSLALLNKVGAEVAVGQAIGARDAEDARLFASHNVMMAVLLATLWGGLLWRWAPSIIGLYRLAQPIEAVASHYLRIVAWGMPFVFLSAAFTGIYNAAGRSKTPFYISSAGLVLNMLLDPLFIFGLGMGTNGAAYATLLSQAFVCLVFVYQIRVRDGLLDRFAFFLAPRKAYLWRILRLGVPVALLNSLFAFVNIFLSRTASQQGGHIGLMTFTTGGQIEAITWNTSQGFSTAVSAFVAQNYAARKTERVTQAWRITLRLAAVFGTLTSFLFVWWGEEIFSLFVPEVAAYRAGGRFLIIDGYSQLFMMLEITMQGFFYGLGRTTPPALVSIGLNYCRIPLALLLIHFGMGVEGIWWAVCLTTIAKGCILTIWFLWLKKRVLLPAS